MKAAAALGMMIALNPAVFSQSSATEETWARLERSVQSGDPEPATQMQCASDLKSINYETPAILRFKNETDEPLTIHWINYKGERDTKWPLAPGAVQNIRTYLTHPFVVADKHGQCLMVYTPSAKPRLALIRWFRHLGQ